MTYLFIEPEQLRHGRVTVTGADAHHLSRVLRCRVGEEVILADGRGQRYRSRIVALRREMVTLEVLHTLEPPPPLPVEVTLCQAIAKGEKMDWIVQKATEVGVARVVPVLTEHTVVRVRTPEEAARKQARWQRVAKEAAQQSRRPTLPEIAPPERLERACRWVEVADLALLCNAAEEQPVRPVLRQMASQVGAANPARVTLFVGPEGGFSPAERGMLTAAGAVSVSLGPTILRTETAALVALALVMYEFGEG